MPGPQLNISRINHINQVLKDYDGAIDFYQRVFGAKLTFDGREQFGPYNNCIFYIGPVIIELFSPCDETGLAKIIQRYGDTWQGVEFLTDNLDTSLEACRSRNLRIVDHNPDWWFFTLPADCFGLCMELVEPEHGTFAEDEGETNPLGIVGLKNLSFAVRDADAATAFYKDLVAGADIVYTEDRPGVNATGVGMNFGRETIEFIAPNGDGAVADYLTKNREQQRGLTLTVSDLAVAEQHLKDSGLRVIDGDAPGTIAIDPADNYNVLYQFSE